MRTSVAVYGTPEPLAVTGSTRVCRIPAINPALEGPHRSDQRAPIYGRYDLAPVVARGPAALRRALAEAASTGEQVRVFDPATCSWWLVT
jgi:hypothetical protein